MPLINDLTLARLAPDIFNAASDAALVREEQSSVTLASGVLTSSASDFITMAYSTGNVVLVDGAVLEIESIDSPTQMTLARVRSTTTDPFATPEDAASVTLSIITFATLISEAESWLVDAFGFNVASPDDLLTDPTLVNLADLQDLIARRVIATAFSIASAGNPDDDSLDSRAAAWMDQFRGRRARTRARIDAHQDGTAEIIRSAVRRTLTRR